MRKVFKIELSVSVLFIILIVGLYFWQRQILNKENYSEDVSIVSSAKLEEEQKAVPKTDHNIDCSISGQSSSTESLKKRTNVFTNREPEWEGGEIIASILDPKDFIIEILDATAYEHGIRTSFVVDAREKNIISSLKFKDVIKAKVYSYTVASSELALETALKDIKKLGTLNTPINYFNTNTDGSKIFTNKSGTLVRYVKIETLKNTILTIYNDGAIYYNELKEPRRLNTDELTKLLQKFNEVNFNQIPYEPPNQFPYSSIVLICNRYQEVPFDKDVPQIKPIIDTLENIIKEYRQHAKRRISYKNKIQLKEWGHEEILALKDAWQPPNKEESERLSKIQLSAEILRDVGYYNDPIKVVFRQNNKIYSAYIRDKCPNGQPNTWACFIASDLERNKETASWPQNLGIYLEHIQKDGVIIPEEEYKAHKEFYDSLIHENPYVIGSSFIEGMFYYTNVKVDIE